MKRRIKILQIGCSNFGIGGRSVAIYNMCDKLDSESFDIRFYADSVLENTKEYEQHLVKRGWGIDYCIVDHSNYIKREFETQIALKRLFKENHYDIVHINADTAWEATKFIIHAYKKAKIIVHAHTTGNDSHRQFAIIKKIIYKIARKYINSRVDVRLACSDEAANYLFGENYRLNKIQILNNAIDFERFKYNEKIRNKIRNKLQISDKKVIGIVGRMVPEKNPFYMIDIFYELTKQDKNWILMWIGDGPLKTDIQKKCREFQLENKILFMGNRNDTNELYQAMDVFVLPSVYEGFGIVNIEAQASGLPCFISNRVPQIVKVINNVEFLPIEKESAYWANQILHSDLKRETVSQRLFEEAGFDLLEVSNCLSTLYKSMLKR